MLKKILDWLIPKKKFCVDCKWHYKLDCTYFTRLSLVTGEVTRYSSSCYAQRESDSDFACGPSGRFFEPKEEL